MPNSRLNSKTTILYASVGEDSGNDSTRWLEFSVGNGIVDLYAEFSSFHNPAANPPVVGHQLNISAIGELRLFFEQADGSFQEDPDYRHRVEFHQHYEAGPPAWTSLSKHPARISGLRLPLLDAPPFATRARLARVFLDLLRGSHDYRNGTIDELVEVVYSNLYVITVEP